MRWPDEPEPPAHINIVPMIDVVFAVLAFFLLSSLYFTRNEGLSVDLPQAQTGAPQPQPSLVVTLAADGRLGVGGQPVQEAQLLAVIQARSAVGQVVILQADQTVSHGRVVAIMDRLSTLEGIQLAIATQPLSPEAVPQ